MMRFLFCSLLLLGACSGGSSAGPTASTPSEAQPAATVRNVDVATLKADLDRHAVPLLVDVRSPEEFAGGHVPGARNVPIDQLQARLSEFGTAAAEVYVICQGGGRSAAASTTLAAKGLHPVNVTGGTSAWKAAGFPVE